MRKEFGVSSHLAIQAIRRVSGAYAKKKGKKAKSVFEKPEQAYSWKGRGEQKKFLRNDQGKQGVKQDMQTMF